MRRGPLQLVFLTVVGVVVAALLVGGTPSSHATDAGSERIEISDVQAGRLLFKAGRLQDALKLLERAQPVGEEERIERLFLLGLIEARLGLPREAARRFEAILAQRPELTRVRLELARIYHALGRDDKARFHFEASLADELPSSVETAVEGFLNRIDARKRWSVSVSAAILPESNPIKRTDSREVLIGGAPFQLNDDARASSGVGVLFSAGTSVSPVITEDFRGVLAASTAAKLYKEPDWNDVSLQGEIGLARLFDNGTASAGLRLGRRWLGGERYSSETGPWMRGRLRVSPARRLEVNLSAARRDHHKQRGQNGWRISAKPGWIHSFNTQTTIETNLDLELVNAREDRHSSRLAGLGIILSHAFKGGFSISPSVSAHVRRHAGPDSLFQKTRSDRQVRFAVNVLHRALQYEGFAPYVGYSFEWNQSNIPINTYRNHGVVFGFSKTF